MKRLTYLWLVCLLPVCVVSTASAVQYTLTTLASFNGVNGDSPLASLTADASGNLYGTTLQGGANGYGTVYELAALTHTLTTLAAFNGANGAGPYGDHAITQSDYNVWKTNFGTHAGSGAGATTSVPEPATLWMLVTGILAMCARLRVAAS